MHCAGSNCASIARLHICKPECRKSNTREFIKYISLPDVSETTFVVSWLHVEINWERPSYVHDAGGRILHSCSTRSAVPRRADLLLRNSATHHEPKASLQVDVSDATVSLEEPLHVLLSGWGTQPSDENTTSTHFDAAGNRTQTGVNAVSGTLAQLSTM